MDKPVKTKKKPHLHGLPENSILIKVVLAEAPVQAPRRPS